MVFFIAISSAVVNHDGWCGTAPDPMVWSAGASPRGTGWFMQFGTWHFCPGHLVFGIQDGLLFLHLLSVLRTLLIGNTGLLVKWDGLFRLTALACWRVGSLGLVASLILNCSFFVSFGLVRLSFEKAVPRYLRPGRPISVSAVPYGLGIDILRCCRFIGALMRSLCFLPGGLGRFVTCSIGAHHCRLRHVGWEKCGHGLTSRPRESASEPFLDEP